MRKETWKHVKVSYKVPETDDEYRARLLVEIKDASDVSSYRDLLLRELFKLDYPEGE